MKEEKDEKFVDESQVLVRKGDVYSVREKSGFNDGKYGDRYNLKITEKLLEEYGKKYMSFLMEVTPSLNANPRIYLAALKNVLDGSCMEMTDSEKNLELCESFCSCGGGGKYVTTGAMEFSGKHNGKDVNGRIGAKWMTSRDVVRVDMGYEAELNKEFLSAVRKALIGINPESIMISPEIELLNRKKIIKLPVEC
ncbi:MAG: hypothetical protein WA139_02320 [Candidatus Aenigmatarchaeota archaeon]